VNAYLIALPITTKLWIPHLVDTQLLTYVTTGGQPVTMFVMKLTLYASGTITGVPA
jgi:hypothetical protein